MRKCRLAGYGYGLPEKTVRFGGQTRYRLERTDDFWELVDRAVAGALDRAGVSMEDVDCIVAAMATPLQPIPYNGALIHERVAGDLDIPAFDINSTCTSFLTGLDMVSYLLDAGRYQRVLLVSGDIASAALNPREKESYELFSDVCTAFVLEQTGQDQGVLYAKQRTWSQGAHQTEIPRGGSLSTAFKLNEDNREDYYFTMQGMKVVRFTLGKLGPFLEECLGECGRKIQDFSLVIPHQASRILASLMGRMGFEKDQYMDLVADYGNMVSGSVPFALCKALETGRLQPGGEVLLMGTAAGLTINFLLLRV